MQVHGQSRVGITCARRPNREPREVATAEAGAVDAVDRLVRSIAIA